MVEVLFRPMPPSYAGRNRPCLRLRPVRDRVGEQSIRPRPRGPVAGVVDAPVADVNGMDRSGTGPAVRSGKSRSRVPPPLFPGPSACWPPGSRPAFVRPYSGTPCRRVAHRRVARSPGLFHVGAELEAARHHRSTAAGHASGQHQPSRPSSQITGLRCRAASSGMSHGVMPIDTAEVGITLASSASSTTSMP